MHDHHRLVMEFLREVGATEVRLDRVRSGRAPHPRIRFLWRGQEQSFVVPGTPGDALRGALNSMAELRHKLGLVRTEKRVGARRETKHRAAGSRPAAACPTLTALPDWRDQLRVRMEMAS